MLTYFVAFAFTGTDGNLQMANTTIDVSTKIRTQADILMLEMQAAKNHTSF